MNGARYWFVVLLLVAVIAMAGLPHAIGREYSLSGAVYHGNEPDTGLTDLWLATLSKQPTLKVLERADIRFILGELSLAGVNDDAARQVRLGRLLGVEYFAWIRAADEQALLEVVEAATGRGIKVVPMAFAKGKFAETLPALAEQAAQAVSQFLPVQTQAVASLAFAIPRISVSNDTVRAAVEKIIADLSGNLSDAGITVLPRRFAADAVQERWRQDKGLVEDATKGREFLGADYIIGAAVDASNRMELVMVETSTGRRVGRKEIALAEAQMADGLKALNQWGMDRLKPLPQSTLAVAPAIATNTHYAAPEILKSLYAGMVLHNQGRYIDAIPCFENSKRRRGRGGEIDAWIISCCRLAGFAEIGEALAAETNFKGRKVAGSAFDTQSEPGVALLGVTADEGVPRNLAERVGVLLIDCLHESSGVTVLAAEDIAGLRDEYDLLLGLDKVKGTTWRQAPPILLRETVTAHLEREKTGIQLRLCMIRNCNPTSICDVVTSLSADSAQWRSVIGKVTKELFSRGSQGLAAWSPPKPKIVEPQQQLLSQLDKSFSPQDYLKALTRDPNLTMYHEEVPWRWELEKWFVRVLPEGHPDRPMLEFSVASLPIMFRLHHSATVLQQSRSEFQKIADKYPEHMVGLLSRYNVALIDMTPTNFAATQKIISKVIPELRRFERQEFYNTIAAISLMDAALRYVLDLPGGRPGDIFRQGNLITVARVSISREGDSFKIEPVPRGRKARAPFSDGDAVSTMTTHNQYLAKTADQMRVDLEAWCVLRDSDAIPVCFLKDIIEKSGPDSELTRFAVLKYFDPMMESLVFKKPGPLSEEDFGAVCQVMAECLQQLPEQDRQPFIRIFKSGLFEIGMPMKYPGLTNALQKVRQLDKTEPVKPPVEEPPRKSFEESWKLGPLKDSTWSGVCMNKEAGRNAMEHYYPFLDRLHELYDDEVKCWSVCRLYCQFGLAFFQAQRYDLAEPLFEQIISWRDYKNRPPEQQTHALSLYLLALIKQRNGDTPAALRLAKEAVEFMDNHRQTMFNLYMFINLDGYAGWGVADELRPRASAFVKQLRENPNLSFKDPYQEHRPSFE